MKKYKNLMELAEAFKGGELEGYTLRLDNDNSSLVWTGANPYPEDSDEYYSYQDAKTDEGYDLFHGNGYADLLDACKAAGIPCEWC